MNSFNSTNSKNSQGSRNTSPLEGIRPANSEFDSGRGVSRNTSPSLLKEGIGVVNSVNSKNSKNSQGSSNTSPSLLKEGIGVVDSNNTSRGVVNPQHLTVIRHYLKHGNKTEAYLKAYPGSTEASARRSASRLFRRREVQAYIRQRQANAQARVAGELEDQLVEEYLTIHQKRQLLTAMMLGRHKVNRYFKVNGQIERLEDNIAPGILLRAIDMDTKIENGWYDRKLIPAIAEQKQPKEPPRPKPTNLVMYFGKYPNNDGYPILKDEEEKALWQLSLKHDNIDSGKPTIAHRYQDMGCTVRRDMVSGRWLMTCPSSIEDKFNEHEKSLIVNNEMLQPFDDEQIANIAKNSRVITEMLNYEIMLILRPNGGFGGGARRDEKENNPVAEAFASLQAYASTHEIEKEEEEKEKKEKEEEKEEEEEEEEETEWESWSAEKLTEAIEELNEYRPVKELWQQYWDNYLKKENSGTLHQYKEIETMYKAIKLPPAKRKEIESKTSWQFHPENPFLIRKKSA